MVTGKTHIVIPVRDQLHLTRSIVEQLSLQSGWDKCWILDNGSEDDTWGYLSTLSGQDGRYQPVTAIGAGIYEMWDEGFRLAVTQGAEAVAILNNDLMLAPGTVDGLRNALLENRNAWISYPDYTNESPECPLSYEVTKGTYRHGGMSGFCFMLRTECIDWSPLVDPRFKWWGGDDDIAFEVEKRGGEQVRVVGLPVTHLMEGTARHHNLGAQKAIDLESVLEKWGR